jgi:hypothetical protein
MLFILVWQLFIFIREGYYKDCKLSALVCFDSGNAKNIQKITFISPVLHPFVNFDSGAFDLEKFNELHKKEEKVY